MSEIEDQLREELRVVRAENVKLRSMLALMVEAITTVTNGLGAVRDRLDEIDAKG